MIAASLSQGLQSGLVQDVAVWVHEFFATCSYVLLAVHLTGALYSRLKNEGIWSSMVPFWQEHSTEQSQRILGLLALENKILDRIASVLRIKEPRSSDT